MPASPPPAPLPGLLPTNTHKTQALIKLRSGAIQLHHCASAVLVCHSLPKTTHRINLPVSSVRKANQNLSVQRSSLKTCPPYHMTIVVLHARIERVETTVHSPHSRQTICILPGGVPMTLRTPSRRKYLLPCKTSEIYRLTNIGRPDITARIVPCRCIISFFATTKHIGHQNLSGSLLDEPRTEICLTKPYEIRNLFSTGYNG